MPHMTFESETHPHISVNLKGVESPGVTPGTSSPLVGSTYGPEPYPTYPLFTPIQAPTYVDFSSSFSHGAAPQHPTEYQAPFAPHTVQRILESASVGAPMLATGSGPLAPLPVTAQYQPPGSFEDGATMGQGWVEEQSAVTPGSIQVPCLHVAAP